MVLLKKLAQTYRDVFTEFFKSCPNLPPLHTPIAPTKGVRKGGVGVNPPLELDILQKLYHLRKEIKCFRILFAC